MGQGMEPAATLRQHPDVGYFLRDILALYRNGPAGGSKPIRSHMNTVRKALAAALRTDLTMDLKKPQERPVCAHLPRAVDNGARGPLAGTVRMFARIAPLLVWGYGYERLPARMETTYAYAEILGPHGPVVCPNLVVGVVLLAPGSLYPAHSHQGITESYVCLSGDLSQNDTGVYVPGSMIFNPPEHSHRITTGRREPCLLGYAWSGPAEALAGQQMTFSRKRG